MKTIIDTDSLNAFCKSAADYSYITVDTEFLRERTYYSKLCLIQLLTYWLNLLELEILFDMNHFLWNIVFCRRLLRSAVGLQWLVPNRCLQLKLINSHEKFHLFAIKKPIDFDCILIKPKMMEMPRDSTFMTLQTSSFVWIRCNMVKIPSSR